MVGGGPYFKCHWLNPQQHENSKMAIPSQNTRSGVEFGFHLALLLRASGGELLSVSREFSRLATSDLLWAIQRTPASFEAERAIN